MFINDLKEGEEYELLIRNALHKEFGVLFSKNEQRKGIDLLHPLMQLEVKKDRGVNKTGNYFFEYMSNGRKGGIFKYGENEERATFFGVGNDEEFLLFYLPHLQKLFYEWVEEGKYRMVGNAGDGGRVKGILVPREDLREQALYIINLNTENDLHK